MALLFQADSLPAASEGLYCAKICKNLIIGPAKLIEVSPEGDFKDSITRKRWLGMVFKLINLGK